MKISKNKTAAIMIIIFFLLSVTASIAIIPNANAHTPPWTWPTWMYCVVSPNPVGVGQTALVVFWLNDIPTTANGMYGDRWTFYLYITAPDGTNTTVGPITSDPIGTGYYSFIPSAIGNYTFVAHFVDHVLNGGIPNPIPGANVNANTPLLNDTFSASTSPPCTLIVQQAQLTMLPETPLPTDYWQTPINAYNRNWASISGNWLATTFPIVSGYQPFSTGPSTAHIVWTRPTAEGGIAGGLSGVAAQGGSISYYDGSSYEVMWNPPIIINGILYYNVMIPQAREGWYAVDMRTGKTLWFYNCTDPLQNGYMSSFNAALISGNLPQLSFGQVLDVNNPDQGGTNAYLWSAYTNYSASAGPFPVTRIVWNMFDAFYGTYICNFYNVPTSEGNVTTLQVTDPLDGSILIYCLDPFAGWLACWNSSKTINYGMSLFGSNNYWRWRPLLNYTYDGRNGYEWNITIPKDLPINSYAGGSAGVPVASMYAAILPGGSLSESDPSMILGSSAMGGYTTGPYSIWALSLDPSNRGTLLWRNTYSGPMNNPAYANTTVTINGADGSTGIFTVRIKETMQMFGFSLTTGTQLWGPTASQNAWNMFDMRSAYAYGNLYSYGQAGTVYCYNMTTGALKWTASTAACGLDGPYDTWPFGVAAGARTAVIADGKIYLTTDEHSEVQPLYRGWATYCWNADTGAPIWNITGVFSTDMQIADGYAVTLNGMDQQIYCFGKGLSCTTIEAPMTAIPAGSSLVIRGTVTDQSPGQTALGIPAAGTPAISDASMTQWMQYLYMNLPKPTNARGVPVSIDAIDPNNNFVHLGDVTSDASGLYSLAVNTNQLGAGPGKYTVIATFSGSDSYYASNAESALLLTEPQATATPTAASQFIAETYFVPAIAGLFILVIVGFIVMALLMLRKRP